MIFHVSVSAADPDRVAAVLAELWRGKLFPFPPVARGSLIVLAGDERNSGIEVYPRGTELVPAQGDADAVSRHNPVADGRSATHVAIVTPLSQEEVLAIAAREGYIAKYRKRGGMFGVVEFRVENALMIEVLTESMVAEYRDSMTPEGYGAALLRVPAMAAWRRSRCNGGRSSGGLRLADPVTTRASCA